MAKTEFNYFLVKRSCARDQGKTEKKKRKKKCFKNVKKFLHWNENFYWNYKYSRRTISLIPLKIFKGHEKSQNQINTHVSKWKETPFQDQKWAIIVILVKARHYSHEHHIFTSTELNFNCKFTKVESYMAFWTLCFHLAAINHLNKS